MKRTAIVLLVLLFLLVVACTSSAQEEEQSVKEAPELYLKYEVPAKEMRIDSFQIRVYFGWRDVVKYNEIYSDLNFDLLVEDCLLEL